MSYENRNVTDNTILKEKLNIEIKRLAQLDKKDYELTRDSVANQFGIRMTALDDFVKDEIQKHQLLKDSNPGGTIMFPQIDPWPEEVNATNLLSELTRTIKNFVTLGEHEAIATALWIMFTHCIDNATVSPILYICSPEKRCGKSTLLSLLGYLVYRPLSAANISPAATFRIVEIHHPCLLLDEVDTFINDKTSELGGIINSGHTRSQAFVMRVVGENHEPRQFSTWCPKCVAGIGGNMPDTTKDRSIFIKLRRKLKNEKVEKLRHANKTEILKLQRQCARFASDNPYIYKTIPTLPEALNDRAADNWEHLFQIASIAGDEWLQNAIEAALAISGDDAEQETKSLSVQLLEDIQDLVDGKFKGTEHILTAELIEALCADEEAPWATFNKYGKDSKITPRQLSNLLKRYDIISKNGGHNRLKGYLKSAFKDAFSRYIQTQLPFFGNASAHAAQSPKEASSSGNDENNSIRSLPLASVLPAHLANNDTDIQTTHASAWSRSERISADNENSKNALEPASLSQRAEGANKTSEIER